ncbi:MAG: hypothetical protein KJN93_04475 [Alphaproteobacteria bacterium]|nr:hypothetical protein [Alphaproteobacteria bacterium]
MLLFRAWPHSTVLENEIQEVHERHLLLARNLAAALERYHRDVSATFSFLIGDVRAWQDTPKISGILENLHFRHICIADRRTGQVIDSVALADMPCPETVPANLVERLESIARDGTIAFGEVVAAPDGANVMQLVAPRDDRTLAFGAIDTT